MASQCPQALPFRDAPYLCSCVVASADHNVSVNLQAPDARLMAYQDVFADALLEIPYPESCIPRSGYGGIGVRHLQTPNRRRVATKGVNRSPVGTLVSVIKTRNRQGKSLPGREIPHAHVAVTAPAH